MPEYDTMKKYEEFGSNELFHVIGENKDPDDIWYKGISPSHEREREGYVQDVVDGALDILDNYQDIVKPPIESRHGNTVFLWPDKEDAIEMAVDARGDTIMPIAVVDTDGIPCQLYAANSQLSADVFHGVMDRQGRLNQLGMSPTLTPEEAAEEYWKSVVPIDEADLGGIRLQSVEILCPCEIPPDAIRRIIDEVTLP